MGVKVRRGGRGNRKVKDTVYFNDARQDAFMEPESAWDEPDH